MSEKYKNPSIVEALCEFQFISDQPWDITIPGLVYEKIKDNFPEKKQQTGMGIQFRQVEKGVGHKIEPVPSRVQFLKKDKTALIQVAHNLLVVNQLKPYPIWEKFKKTILDNFHIYKKIAASKGLERISLRYINVFEFNEAEIKLEDCFKYYPFIPKGLPQNQTSSLTRVEFPYEKNCEKLTLMLATIMPARPDAISLGLDIDYAIDKPEYISLNDVEKWLDKAHGRVEDAFEASITDRTRSMLEKEEKK